MTFEEYWIDVEKIGALSNTAIKHILPSLITKTKKRLMKMRQEGTVESIDGLVRKKL